MTRTISVVSGKGGAGKTTLVANLGAAMASMGKDVVIVDANITTPNLGFHLGIPLYPTTLHDVLKGKATVYDAVYKHYSGMKVIPAGIGVGDLKGVDIKHLPAALSELLGNTDIILIDAAAGLGREALAAMESSDEILLVTNPELPAVADALKAMRLAQQMGTKITGVVINRVQGLPHELTRDEVRSMLDAEVLAEIPEDIAVQEAIAKRLPVIHHRQHSAAGEEIKRLAAMLIGYSYQVRRPWYARLFGIFR